MVTPAARHYYPANEDGASQRLEPGLQRLNDHNKKEIFFL
jgi:hypothetical protein